MNSESTSEGMNEMRFKHQGCEVWESLRDMSCSRGQMCCSSGNPEVCDLCRHHEMTPGLAVTFRSPAQESGSGIWAFRVEQNWGPVPVLFFASCAILSKLYILLKLVSSSIK